MFSELGSSDGRPSSRWFWMTVMAWLKNSASHPQASWPDFWGFVQGVFSFGNEKSIRKECLATKRSTVDLVASKPCMKKHLRLFPAVLYMTEPWGATLKALSLSAAGEIMYPTTMQSFTVESSTNAYGGMGVNVPLGKNRDLPCFNHVQSHQSPCFLEFSWIFSFNWCAFFWGLSWAWPDEDQHEAPFLWHLRQWRHESSRVQAPDICHHAGDLSGVWCCQGWEAGDVLSYGRKQLVTPEVAEAKTWTGMEEQTANNPTTYKWAYMTNQWLRWCHFCDKTLEETPDSTLPVVFSVVALVQLGHDPADVFFLAVACTRFSTF